MSSLDEYLTLFEQSQEVEAVCTGNPSHRAHLTAHARGHVRAGGHAARGGVPIEQPQAATGRPHRTHGTGARHRSTTPQKATRVGSTASYQQAKANLLSATKKPAPLAAATRKSLLVRTQNGFARRNAAGGPAARRATGLADRSLSPPPAPFHRSNPPAHGSHPSAHIYPNGIRSPLEHFSPRAFVRSPTPSIRSPLRALSPAVSSASTFVSPGGTRHSRPFSPTSPAQRARDASMHAQPAYSPERVVNGHPIPFGSDHVPMRASPEVSSPSQPYQQLFNPHEDWEAHADQPTMRSRTFSPMRPITSALAYDGVRPIPSPEPHTMVSPLSSQWMAALRARSQRIQSLQTAVSARSPTSLSPATIPPTPFSPSAHPAHRLHVNQDRPHRDARGSLLMSPLLVGRISLTSTPGTTSLASDSANVSPLQQPTSTAIRTSPTTTKSIVSGGTAQLTDLLSEFRQGWKEIQAASSISALPPHRTFGESTLDLPTRSMPSLATVATPNRSRSGVSAAEIEHKYDQQASSNSAAATHFTSPMRSIATPSKPVASSFSTSFAPSNHVSIATSPMVFPRTPLHATAAAASPSKPYLCVSKEVTGACAVCALHDQRPTHECTCSCNKENAPTTTLSHAIARSTPTSPLLTAASKQHRNVQTSPMPSTPPARSISLTATPAAKIPAKAIAHASTLTSPPPASIFSPAHQAMATPIAPVSSTKPQQPTVISPTLSERLRATMEEVRQLNHRANLAVAQAHEILKSPTTSYLAMPTPAPLPVGRPPDQSLVDPLLHDISTLTHSQGPSMSTSMLSSRGPALNTSPHTRLASPPQDLSTSFNHSLNHSMTMSQQRSVQTSAYGQAPLTLSSSASMPSMPLSFDTQPPPVHEHSDDISRALSASLKNIQQLRQTLSSSRERVQQQLQQSPPYPQTMLRAQPPQSLYQQPHFQPPPPLLYPQQADHTYTLALQHQQQFHSSYAHPETVNLQFSLSPHTATNVIVAPVHELRQDRIYSEAELARPLSLEKQCTKAVAVEPWSMNSLGLTQPNDATEWKTLEKQRRSSIATTLSMTDSPPRSALSSNSSIASLSRTTSPPTPAVSASHLINTSLHRSHAPMTPFTPVHPSTIFARALGEMPLHTTPAMHHQPVVSRPTPAFVSHPTPHRLMNAQTLQRLNQRQ